MSGITDDLPSNKRRWEAAMARMGLTGQTIHGAELDSASKIEYKQFLLLQVLWEIRHIQDLPKLLPDLNNWIVKAEELLKNYKSWQTYCQEFSSKDMGEGNFTIARLYQLEVTNTKDEVDPRSLATPVAHRTRARVLSRKLANMYLATPTKSTNVSESLDVEDLGLDTPEDTPVKSIPETPSPPQETSPPSKEQVGVLFPPTRDEQIVNCALVIFMNALTAPFKLANNWTLHRKAFKADFGDASFEARTDGYLDDRQGNAQAIIEVKPVMRAKKLAAIRMQESAQMVAWVKSDGVQAYKLDKEYVNHLSTIIITK
ncbi:uncharacterized protein BO88DRAFT_471623 [Aspergillus vadensis CBS 113365]|uniref:Uncharacterized protein n=1 Tax=Aspergillus vadensis (strain CBS 113365 / IMI 142717 / IBT 24658) TaxID=1448311 RepID=A0A319B0I8_ASPVC|nr:hypothetical protein BO88DRAFT_471623 [Aspergillus vadensis CBS 113365]PYH65241.1 hypothetical protein BO88DRAFT_471623 [Aspergillus vadensis CBS 113365]